MRKNLLLLAVICFSLATNAQNTKKVFGTPIIGWYGLDFTKAKMVGWTESPHQIRDEFFPAWNASLQDVPFAQVFQKTGAYKELNGINKANLARETDDLVGKDADIKNETIAEMVKELSTGQKKDGLGVVFIVQSFDKTAELATVYVTFFDIATHNVCLVKKLTGKSAKGNPKTGWTAAVKDILNKIQKSEFSAWKKEANY